MPALTIHPSLAVRTTTTVANHETDHEIGGGF